MPAEEDDYAVTRKVGYLHTLKQAPAFSFGVKRERRIDDPGPGPGQYGPSLDFSHPGVRFGSSTRYTNPGTNTPSPIDYKPDANKVLRGSASYTFGGKHKPSKEASRTPGPGAYDASAKDTVKPSPPAVTISGRTARDNDSDRKPGPNEYNPDYRVKENPGVSIKFKHEPNLNSGHEVPGPGQYDVDKGYKGPNGRTFGTSREFSHLETPSPGPVYNTDRGYEAVRPRRASWSISRSPRSGRYDNGVPGPGTYAQPPVVERQAGHSVRSEERSAPAVTITARYAGMRPPAQPGPSDYNPKDSVRRSAPCFTFHGSATVDSRRNYPGPGAYEAGLAKEKTKPTPPAISIAFKPDAPGCLNHSPGPNEYTPDYRVKENPGVSLKFKHEARFTNEMHGTPAPHDYADKDFQDIHKNAFSVVPKGYTFGVRPKPNKLHPTPGPHYKIGCSTLGIAASEKLKKSELDRVVVL